jgi:hypothetical protein
MLMSRQDWNAVLSQVRAQLSIGQHRSESFTYYN